MQQPATLTAHGGSHGGARAEPAKCWRRGVCAITEDSEGKFCKTGELKGSWPIQDVEKCLARCRDCPQCHFVSYMEGDCSWFAHCDAPLTATKTRHGTRQVRHADGSLVAACETEQWPSEGIEKVRFYQLPVATDCCENRQIFGALAYQRYGRVLPGGGPMGTAGACALSCLLTKGCNFFSVLDDGYCGLCNQCEARERRGAVAWAHNGAWSHDAGGFVSPQSAWAVDLSKQLQRSMSSSSSFWSFWSSSSSASSSSSSSSSWEVDDERSGQREAVRPLYQTLQQQYSKRVYGLEGRMPPLESLGILWLGLMSEAELDAVRAIRPCRNSDVLLPHHPLYASNGRNVMSSLWLHREPARKAVPSHGWAEVTHSPLKHDPLWSSGPMWLFVTPGSGISVNVGRTLVVGSYGEAYQLIQCSLLPLRGAIQQQPQGVREDCKRHHHHPPKHDHASPLPTWVSSPDEFWRSYDSLQVLTHQEYYSNEPRHELILLHRNETDALTSRMEGLMCGRWPYLAPCDKKSDVLRLMHLGRAAISGLASVGELLKGSLLDCDEDMHNHHTNCFHSTSTTTAAGVKGSRRHEHAVPELSPTIEMNESTVLNGVVARRWCPRLTPA